MRYKPAFILVIYLLILLGYTLTRGLYTFGAYTATFSALVLFWIYYLNPKIIDIESFSTKASLVLPFVTSIFLSAILYGGLYQQHNLFYIASKYLLVIACLISLTYFFHSKLSFLKNRFLLLILISIILQIFMICSSLHPIIDVYDQLNLGSLGLLKGMNPYTQTFPQIYNYPQDYFPYLPLAAIVVLPFNLLLSDPRFALIAANLIIAIIIRNIIPKSENLSREILPLLVLFNPQLTFTLEQSWIDPIILALFCLFIYSYYKNKSSVLTAVFLGGAIGIKQTFPLIIPFLFLYKNFNRKIIFIALFILFLTTFPFYLWNPHAFYIDVIKNHLDRGLWWHNSLTLNSLVFAESKLNLNSIFLTSVWILSFILIAKRGFDSLANLVLGITLWLFTFYVINYQAFIHYYVVISNLLLLSLALSKNKNQAQFSNKKMV